MGSDRNKRRRNIIIGIIMVFLMIGGVGIGFFTSEDTAKAEYNGHTFYQKGNIWFTRIENQRVEFLYLPQDVENIQSEGNIDTEAEKAYLVVESGDELNTRYSAERLRGILLYFTGLRVVNACLNEEGCEQSWPIVSCDDAEAQVIYFPAGNATTMEKSDGQCMVMQAADNIELEKLTEKAVFKALKIME